MDLSYTGYVVDNCKAIQRRHFEVVSISFIFKLMNKFAYTLVRATRSQPPARATHYGLSV